MNPRRDVEAPGGGAYASRTPASPLDPLTPVLAPAWPISSFALARWLALTGVLWLAAGVLADWQTAQRRVLFPRYSLFIVAHAHEGSSPE